MSAGDSAGAIGQEAGTLLDFMLAPERSAD
jgi:hypothetical protein